MEKLTKLFANFIDCLENSRVSKGANSPEDKMRKIELMNEFDKILSMPNDANLTDDTIDLQSLKLAERMKSYVK